MLLKTEDSQHELANQRTSDDKIYNPTPLKSNHHTVDIIRSIQNTKIEDNKANKSNSLPPSVGVAVPVDLDRRSPEISQEQLFEQAEWHTFINLDKAKLQLQQQHYRTNSDLSPFSSFFPFNQRYNCHNQIDSNAGNEMNQTAISLQNITKIDAPVIKCGTQIKEEVVPRSMEEIYQLSNQNRKRNKEKKKLKEDSIIQASTSVQPVDDTEFRDENEGKCDAAAPEDTQEFMKKIGWISDYNFDSTSPASYDPNHNKHRRTKSSPINNNNNNNNNSNSNNNNNSNHNHSAPTNKDDPLNPHSQYKDTPKHKRYSKHQNKTFPMTNNKHNHNYHHHQNHYHSNYFFDNNQNNQNNNNNNNNNNGNSNNSNYNKSSNDTKFVNNSEERSYSYSSRTSSYSQPRGSSGNNSPTSNRSRPKGARGNQVFVAKSVQKTVPQKY